MEVEDDVFFADISRQIGLLIMDDDEEFSLQNPPTAHAQVFHHVPIARYHLPQAIMPPLPLAYEMAYRRESKGTGVFIPRSSPKRKNRPGISSATNNSSYRQLDKSGVAVAQSNDSRLHSNYYNSGTVKNHA